MNTNNQAQEALNVVLNEHGNSLKDANIETTIKAMEPDLRHEAEWPTEFFEVHLGKVRQTVSFGKAMSRLTQRLEADGYHLTSRGKNATSWWVEKIQNTGRVVGGNAPQGHEPAQEERGSGQQHGYPAQRQADRERAPSLGTQRPGAGHPLPDGLPHPLT